MSCTIVQAQTRRKANSTLKPILLYKRTSTILNKLCDFCHRQSRPDELPSTLPYLTMHLCPTTDIVICRFGIFIRYFLFIPLFFGGNSPSVTVENMYRFTSDSKKRVKVVHTHLCKVVSRPLDKYHRGKAWTSQRAADLIVPISSS